MRKKEFYTFEHQFNQEELEEKGKQLAIACAERTKLEDEKKEINAEFKVKIDSKTEAITELSTHINEGSAKVNRACEVEYDRAKAVKHYFFEGVRVGTENMTKEDFQLELHEQFAD